MKSHNFQGPVVKKKKQPHQQQIKKNKQTKLPWNSSGRWRKLQHLREFSLYWSDYTQLLYQLFRFFFPLIPAKCKQSFNNNIIIEIQPYDIEEKIVKYYMPDVHSSSPYLDGSESVMQF